MYKKLIVGTACIAFQSLTFGQELKITKSTNAKLQQANIYFGNGAELSHLAKFDVDKGMQEVTVNLMSTTLDPNTIQITCSENVTVLSHRYNVKYETTTTINPIIAKMEDSIKAIQKQVNLLTQDYQVQEHLLLKTAALVETYTNSKSKNINGAEIMKLLEFYTLKIQQYKTSLNVLSNKKDDLNATIYEIELRKSIAISTGNKTTSKTIGQIILQLLAKKTGAEEVELSYYTQRAGWIPTYEMRVKSIDNSFKLGYKALVSQTTGIDWKDTKLTLSTNNPNQSNTAPLLSAWYLQMYVPQLYETLKKSQMNMKYNSIQPSSMNEVVVTGYRSDNEYKPKEKQEDISQYLNIKESQLFTSFEIDLPYDIPADGKGYNVSIKEENIKATYKHYAVPKLDKDAFLMAEVNDWENLDLLPGEANIIMDGRYIGKSFIDPNTTLDTLNISLGRDKRVSLKRTLVKNGDKPKIKGDYKIETFIYELIAKNNKKQNINLLLKDQFPISKDKEIEVILVDDGSAEVNNELGVLNWKFELAANETKKIRFIYTIKYPKDKIIVNLR